MKAHLPLECWRWRDHCWAHCPSCWKHWQWACTLRTVQGPARWQESSSQGKKVFCGHPKSCWAPTNFVSSTSEPVRGKWWQTGMKDTFEQIAHSGWKEEKDRDRQKTLRSGNSFLAFLFNEADVRNKASYLNCESETWLFFFLPITSNKSTNLFQSRCHRLTPKTEMPPCVHAEISLLRLCNTEDRSVKGGEVCKHLLKWAPE